MDKPVIFLDFDGSLASQGKIWREDLKVGISEKPPWTAERMSGPGNLSVYKTISDHDSWAIDYFKEHAHIIIISGDERINRAWAERRDVPFIFTAAAGFHQDKMGFLIDYWNENFPGEPEGSYYYLGDAMPDWKCMLNAKRAFVPLDASHFITNKMENHKNMEWMCVNSGQGCFDEMAWLLVQEGVLSNV